MRGQWLNEAGNRPIQCSILSERRVFRPYGLHGGEDGQRGRNVWVKQRRAADGDLDESSPKDAKKKTQEPRRINLGGKATVKMGKGDRIVIWTPGGGGWGREGSGEKQFSPDENVAKHGRGDPRGSVAERQAAAEGV